MIICYLLCSNECNASFPLKKSLLFHVSHSEKDTNLGFSLSEFLIYIVRVFPLVF